jgi:hypothetical protein
VQQTQALQALIAIKKRAFALRPVERVERVANKPTPDGMRKTGPFAGAALAVL